MCDYGRMNYRWMNRGDRIEAPLVRDGGRPIATDWDTALDRLAPAARGTRREPAVILASGRASTESLGLVRRLLERPRRDRRGAGPDGRGSAAGRDSRTWRSARSGLANLSGAGCSGYTDRLVRPHSTPYPTASLVIVLDAELDRREDGRRWPGAGARGRARHGRADALAPGAAGAAR